MPSRNVLRLDFEHSYYHVYVRGINKMQIFQDSSDKDYFLGLFDRHLSEKQHISSKGYMYPSYRGQVELLCYCLMDNHFHLMFYQIEKTTIAQLMRSIMNAYTTYFNRKYKRTGSITESRYKSSHIDSDPYLHHISRYIHLNPRSWKYYPYSSINYFRKGNEPQWLDTSKVLALFDDDRKGYIDFVSDYEESKELLDELKWQLANGV